MPLLGALNEEQQQFSLGEDDGGGWWVGVQRCAATVAVAVTVALSANAAQQSQSVADSVEDEVPYTPANGSSANNSFFLVVQNNRYNVIYSHQDDAVPLITVLDEDYWISPVQPTWGNSPPWVGADDDVIELNVPMGTDEDFWINPVPPIPATLYQLLPYLPDPEEIPANTLYGQPDEDFWSYGIRTTSPWNVLVFSSSATPTPLPPTLDEDYWINPVAPVWQLFAPLYLPDPEEIPANTLYGQPDEDFWINPVPPVPTTLYQRLPYLPDPEEIPAGSLMTPTTYLDEDFWVNPVAPVPLSFRPIYLPDPEEIPSGNLKGQPDEDFWVNPVAPVPLSFRPIYLPDPEEIPAGSLKGQPDEDFWINPVPPVPTTLYQRLPYLPDPEEIPAGYLVVTTATYLDEDFWTNPVPPVPSYPVPKLFSDDDIIAQVPTSIGTDEDFWINPVPPVPATLYQRLPYLPDPEEIPAGNLVGPLPTFLDEDLWPSSVRVYQPWRTLLFTSNAGTTALVTPLKLDEDFWQNLIVPSPILMGRLYLPDPEEIPAGNLHGPGIGQPDEDFWTNSVPPVPATLYQPPLYLPDPEEIPAGHLIGPATIISDDDNWAIVPLTYDPLYQIMLFMDDGSTVTDFQPVEDFWLANVVIVPPVPSYPVPKIFTDDDVITQAPIAIKTDEDFWINPVAPVPLSFRPIYLPDPEEIPAGNLVGPPLIGQPDEDFWINPVPPVPATLYQRLPYLPDPEEIPVGTLHGQPDEDYWINPVIPVQSSLFQLLPYAVFFGPEEIQLTNLFGQPDEDFWINPVPPVPAILYQPPLYLPDPEEIPAGHLFGQSDEDFWINPVTPKWGSNFVAIIYPSDEDYAVLGQDEDYWINPVQPSLTYWNNSVFNTDDLFGVPPPIPDEDFWINPVQPISSYIPPQVFLDDEVFFTVPPALDEGLWINTVQSTTLMPSPGLFGMLYLPDYDEIPAGNLNTPIITGISSLQVQVGEILLINGLGFGAPQGDSTITFNGVEALVFVWSRKKILCQVPKVSQSAILEITVNGISAQIQYIEALTAIPDLVPELPSLILTVESSDSFQGPDQVPLDPTKWERIGSGTNDQLEVLGGVCTTTIGSTNPEDQGNGLSENIEVNWLAFPDQWAEITIVRLTDSGGVRLTLRSQNTNSDPFVCPCYAFDFDAQGYTIQSFDVTGGVINNTWASNSLSIVPGDVLRVAVIGQGTGSLYFFKNDVLIFSGLLSDDTVGGIIPSGAPTLTCVTDSSPLNQNDIAVINWRAGRATLGSIQGQPPVTFFG